MKPQLDDEIYVISNKRVFKQRVMYLGKESFLISRTHCAEFKYDQYGETWVFNLDDIKLQYNERIVKINEYVWEIQEKTELEPIDIDL